MNVMHQSLYYTIPEINEACNPPSSPPPPSYLLPDQLYWKVTSGVYCLPGYKKPVKIATVMPKGLAGFQIADAFLT